MTQAKNFIEEVCVTATSAFVKSGTKRKKIGEKYNIDKFELIKMGMNDYYNSARVGEKYVSL